MANRRQGRAAEAVFKTAAHVTKIDLINNRLVPNAMEPRAAIADYDAGTDALTLWNTTQNPHVARLVISAFVGMAPEHKLRVIAPRCRGRLWLEDLHLSRGGGLPLGGAATAPCAVKWNSDRSAKPSSPIAMGAIMSP